MNERENEIRESIWNKEGAIIQEEFMIKTLKRLKKGEQIKMNGKG